MHNGFVMELQEIGSIAAIIITSLGGGAAIVLGFSSWLGKVWAARLMAKEKAEHTRELEALRNQLTQDTESYKIRLKKSEFLFEKQFEATSEFITLIWACAPEIHRPDMDWHDACDDIARNFTKLEKSLFSFLSKHAAVLDDETENQINEAISLAAFHKFGADSEEVSEGANQAADELFTTEGIIPKIESRLKNMVHSQSST